MEWFAQCGVRFAATHREFILRRLGEIPREIKAKQAEVVSATEERRDRLKKEISKLDRDERHWRGGSNPLDRAGVVRAARCRAWFDGLRGRSRGAIG